ncbi:MAG: DUF4115 domain-containing protein [Desulfuromonadaceae bacterium]|nr:DUF4115 domain-containing protein [Desulfuromonadaceae bacterium]MDD2850000.1 DUF4115 domain-containing protein [Desulfuromonadaceae bacterium]MDD4129977.1 DUF4115 domain-containing protein [Desulfuromonadaceae bacterium]
MKISGEKTIPVSEEEVKPVSLKKLPDLKGLREVRELTINDIFLKTRISIANLEAIENGEYHLLPAPVYTRKFIESYAKALDIDAADILAHYQHHLDETTVIPEETKVATTESDFDHKPFKRFLLYAVFAVAVSATAFAIYAFFSEDYILGTIQRNMTGAEPKDVVPQPAAAVKEIPPQVAPDATQTPPPAVVAQDGTAQNPDNANLDLLIEATENTWLNITEDRNPPSQTTLKAGEKLSRTAREFFIVDVGNAAGVNITFRGKPLGNLGQRGQVVHLRLPQQ